MEPYSTGDRVKPTAMAYAGASSSFESSSYGSNFGVSLTWAPRGWSRKGCERVCGRGVVLRREEEEFMARPCGGSNAHMKPDPAGENPASGFRFVPRQRRSDSAVLVPAGSCQSVASGGFLSQRDPRVSFRDCPLTRACMHIYFLFL